MLFRSARDLLVVPVVGDQAYDGGWTGPLDRAMYPPLDRRREAQPAPSCPPFKRDSVLARPDNETASARTVSSGAHHMDGTTPEGGFTVVWWDPFALSLGAEPPFGLRRQELISRDVAPATVAAAEQRYITWRNGRDAARALGARPSLRVQTASGFAALSKDRKSTRLNSSHVSESRMPSSA